MPCGRHARSRRSIRSRRGCSRPSSVSTGSATLAHLESGAGNPTLAVLSSVADAFQVTLEELVGALRRSLVEAPQTAIGLDPEAGFPSGMGNNPKEPDY